MRVAPNDPGLVYVQARAAAMSGDHARAAGLLASLAEAEPNQADLARKALIEAVGAGQIDLALQLATNLPPAKLTPDARLLLAAQELRRNQPNRALQWLRTPSETGTLEFITPLLTAWAYADRGDLKDALQTVQQIPPNSLLGPLRAEQQALILLKFRRAAEAEPFAKQAAESAGSRENQVRLALADGFLSAGDQARALAIVEGMGTETAGP